MGNQSLKGKRIAFLATDGFEQVEMTQPWDAAIPGERPSIDFLRV